MIEEINYSDRGESEISDVRSQKKNQGESETISDGRLQSHRGKSETILP